MKQNYKKKPFSALEDLMKSRDRGKVVFTLETDLFHLLAAGILLEKRVDELEKLVTELKHSTNSAQQR